VAKNTGVGGGTTLVGGLRGGGRGIFALDISDGPGMDKGDVLWEYTHKDDLDLGYTYSNITVAKMNTGKWAAIFGNGYCDEPSEECGSGEAQLFIVSLEDGQLIKKISTTRSNTSERNGLSTPGVADLDANGTADWVYAGDLEGNLWAFDLTGDTVGEWDLAYKLFKTPDNQPITSEPMLVKHPLLHDDPINPDAFHDSAKRDDDTSNYPNTLVLFGTGQYLVEGDKSSNDLQAFYGIWDDGTVGDLPLKTENLQQQTFLSGVQSGYRALTNEEVDYTGEGSQKQYGWYLELTHSKERVINRATVRNNVVFFDTIIPSNSVCDYGGAGYLMAVDLSNGGNPKKAEFDTNNDRYVDSTDEVTRDVVDGDTTTIPPAGRYHDGGMPVSEIMGDEIVTNDTNQPQGTPQQTRVRPAKDGRLSWEEL
jgi:type IV pilus assembly protein PilY1